MTHPLVVATLALGMLGLRVSGLTLSSVHIPTEWERAWRFVPLALLSALVVLSLTGRDSGETAIRAMALVAAALITYRARRLWVCIASGMVVYFVLRMAA
jgi:branched-subunit amino acid transport protein